MPLGVEQNYAEVVKMKLPILTSVSGVSDDVANGALGGELVGRILGSVILAYLVMLMLRIAYKLFQGARSVLLNGEGRTEKIRRGLDCVPWWLMFLVFAVQFCTFTEGWRNIPGPMCFALTVCLAVVFILWNKQRHGKRTRDEAKTNGASITPVQSAELTFACPHCGQHLSADADMIGMQVDCPACQNNFVLPHTNFGEMNHCSIETTRLKRNIPLFALLCIVCAGTIADVIRFFSNLSEGMEMLAQMSNGFVAFITLSSCFISSIVIKWGVLWYLIIKLSAKKYFWLRRATIFWLVSACIACILQYFFNYAWVVLSDVEIGGILADASVFDFVPETSLIAAIVLIVRSRKIRSILVAKVAGQRVKIYGNLAGLAIAIVFLPLLTCVAWLNVDADSAIRNPNQQTNSKTAKGCIAPILFLWVLREAFRSLAEACNGDVKKSRDEKILK